MTSRGMRSEMTLARHFSRSYGTAAHHAAASALAALAALASAIVAAQAQQASDWQPTVTDDTGAKNPGKKKHGAKAATPPAEEAPTTTAKADPTIPVIKPGTQSIVALINDEPITGYEIDERVTLSLLGSPELQQRMQAKLKSGNVNDQFKAFALKRLQADPPKTQAEQQARVKQLQAQFVESLKSQVLAEFKPTARLHAVDELIE